MQRLLTLVNTVPSKSRLSVASFPFPGYRSVKFQRNCYMSCAVKQGALLVAGNTSLKSQRQSMCGHLCGHWAKHALAPWLSLSSGTMPGQRISCWMSVCYRVSGGNELGHQVGGHDSMTRDSTFLEGLVCLFSTKYEVTIPALQEKDGTIDLLSTVTGSLHPSDSSTLWSCLHYVLETVMVN